MLLPTKGLSTDRALLTVGAEVIAIMKQYRSNRHMSESEIWESYQMKNSQRTDASLVTFDWFALALTLLFALGIINYDEFGRLELTRVSS